MDVRSAYWQFSVSSQHMVKSWTVNPYMSLFNLKLCTHILVCSLLFPSPNGITIGSAVFARLTHVTNAQTDKQTCTQTTLHQETRRNSVYLALLAVLAMCHP